MLRRIIDIIRGDTPREVSEASKEYRRVAEVSITQAHRSSNTVRDISHATKTALETLQRSWEN